MVFNLITLSHNALYLYQVSQKYLKGFQTYWVDTIFYYQLQMSKIPWKTKE